MKDRLKNLDFSEEKQPLICTLHSLALRILIESGKEINIADDYEGQLLLEDVLLEKKPKIFLGKNKRKVIKKIYEKIHLYIAKQRYKDLDEEEKEINNEFKNILDEYNAVNFERLILEANKTLEKNNEILEKFKKQCKYFLIDEFQDITPLELELIKKVTENGKGLFAVADDDQSIYGWRGSDVQIILNIEEHFKNIEIRYLTKCYRCPKCILDAAKCVIERNKNRRIKKLESNNLIEGKIVFLNCRSDKKEAEFIKDRILYFKKDGVSLANIGVIYPGGDIADKIIEELRSENVPIERPDPKQAIYLKQFIALLRLISDKRDDLAVRVCLSSHFVKGVGPKTIQKIRKASKEQKCSLWEIILTKKDFAGINKGISKALYDFAEFIKEASVRSSKLDVSDLLKFVAVKKNCLNLEKVTDLIFVAKNYSEFNEFLKELKLNKLQKGEDYLRGQNLKESVLFTTFHSVKGLEKDIIFILGLEKGRFPSANKLKHEERRLFYVTLTRPKKKLLLSYSKRRKGKSAGGYREYEVSPFIYEIPEKFIDEKIL